MESTEQRKLHGQQGYYFSDSTKLNNNTLDQAHDEHLELQKSLRHPIAFHNEMMGNIMYYHQAMNQDNMDDFVKSIVK